MMDEAQQFVAPATKEQLLAQFDSEYAALVALVESVPMPERLTPLVDELSIKDLIAHIQDWQAFVLRRMRLAAAGESLPPRVPDGNYDRVNAEIYAANRDRSWDDIWNEFVQSAATMRAEVERLSDEDLFSAERVKAIMGLPDYRAVDYIVGNTSEHYWEHAQQIRERRA